MIWAAAALLVAAAVPGGPSDAEPELPTACSDAALAADLTSCDKEIAGATDKRIKARLLFHRAYAFNAKYKYDEALKDLNEAVALDPSYPNAWHERAYTLGELSEFRQAIGDLDREIALRPSVSAYQERAYARHWNGDFAGAWVDRNHIVELQPKLPNALLARADEALWLGRYEDARRDVAAAEALARNADDAEATQAVQKMRQRIALLSTSNASGSPADRCHAADKEGKFERSNLIGDCTAAFLAASGGKEKAEILTIRSLAWLSAAQDQVASTDDRRVAVSLDPGNGSLHANLGFAYLSGHHSWAAEREFNQGLASRFGWMALAGRASARYNLGRKGEAFADAKKSFEQHPNELALTVLGDLAHDRNDDKSARLYWMGAYHLGDRDDGLIERLKSIGIDRPENEPAQ